jgi:hypothetical protein
MDPSDRRQMTVSVKQCLTSIIPAHHPSPSIHHISEASFSPDTLLGTPLNRLDMVCDKTLKLFTAVIERVPVVWRGTAAQGIPILPVKVGRDARRVQSCILPLFLNGAVVRRHAIFFEQTRFSSGGAGSGVRSDPELAPVVICAPCFFVSFVFCAR